MPVATPACVTDLGMPLVPKGSRSEYRAWGLFSFCPREATGSAAMGAGLLLGHTGAGDQAYVTLPARGQEGHPGGLAAFVGKAVLSQLIALTPGQIPTPRWPPPLRDRHLHCKGSSALSRLVSLLPPLPSGQIHLHGGGGVEAPRPAGHVSGTRSPLSCFSPGPRFALWFLTVITESSSRGTCFSLRGLCRAHGAGGPAAPLLPAPSLGPGPSRPLRPCPSRLPGGRGEQKVPLCPPGRLEGDGSTSGAPPPARVSLRLLPSGAAAGPGSLPRPGPA